MLNGNTRHQHYFSMVHRVIEQGWKEANKFLRDVRKSSLECAVKKPRKCSVVIIGAGMAGLGAARELIAAGINDIIILEAQAQAGGRVCTVPLENGHIELGAQWIHGEDNPIYRFAHKHNLLSGTTSVEGLGPYLRTDGTELCSSLVAHVTHKISCFLEDCEKFTESSDNFPTSVGHYLEERFKDYLESCCEDSEEERTMKQELFQWHLRFQEIDNSCSELKTLSAKDWGKYEFTGGEDCINLRNGYSSVVNGLIEDLPDNIIHYNSAVKKVIWKETFPALSCSSSRSSTSDDLSLFPAAVKCDDGSVIHALHVIVTCSIGYLKANHRAMFEPPLPLSLTNVIDSMGFGVVDKIFLYYDKPWWDEERQAFQIVRSLAEQNDKNCGESDWWLNDVTGFDVLAGEPAVLLAWVGGNGATFMEQLEDDDIAHHCTNLLQKCLKNPSIPLPTFIKRSSWLKNPYIKGGYSHTTTLCDKYGFGPKDLTVPVYSATMKDTEKHPVVLFAGEAAHESHFSTAHGAFESGQSQARVLVNYNKVFCSNDKRP